MKFLFVTNIKVVDASGTKWEFYEFMLDKTRTFSSYWHPSLTYMIDNIWINYEN